MISKGKKFVQTSLTQKQQFMSHIFVANS